MKTGIKKFIKAHAKDVKNITYRSKDFIKIYTLWLKKFPTLPLTKYALYKLCELFNSRTFRLDPYIKKCPGCNNYHVKHGPYCSRTCAGSDPKRAKKIKQTKLSYSPERKEEIKNKRKQTNIRKYGTEHPMQSDVIKLKVQQTNLKKYGNVCSAQGKEQQEKRKQTFIKHYGVEHNWCSNSLGRKRYNDTMLEKYGVTIPAKNKEIKSKIQQTNLKKYGNKVFLASKEGKMKIKSILHNKYGVDNIRHIPGVQEKIENTCLVKYGVRNPLSAPEIKAKIRQTNYIKYNACHYVSSKEGRKFLSKIISSEEVQAKSYKTRKRNGTFNSSLEEDKLFILLKNYFPRVIRQYKETRYPFSCDFYIPINDLFIEYQGSWLHGDEPYNKNKTKHIKIKRELNLKTKPMYKRALEVWTQIDPRKRKTARKNNLNWKEFFNKMEISEWLGTRYSNEYYNKLLLQFRLEDLIREYTIIQRTKPSYASVPRHNRTILQFQQDLFYRREKKLWKSKEIRNKLVANRIKYIGKGWGDLTAQEILRGFKISGINKKAFSHFSHQWMRKFIEEYGIKSIYDPCGGWGHRLIACSKDFKYIYNDIRKKVTSNCKEIANFLGMTNKYFYSRDAASFTPKEKYDAVFTCPPYWNLEKYSKKGAENLDYKDFLKWWEKVVKRACKRKPRYFAFVISEALRRDMTGVCKKVGLKFVMREELGRSKSHFNKSASLKSEVLVIMKI